MSTTGRYRLAFRRRATGRTDYYQRKALLQSGLPRFAVRLGSNSIQIQILKPVVKGDLVLVHANSIELKRDYGWLGGSGNLPASYLTGLLAGLKAKKQGVIEGVLDAGLQRPTKGSRLSSALKGIVDGGVEIPHSEEIMPSEERLSGAHIADYASKQAAKDEATLKARFSQYLRRGLQPQNLPSHFEEVKKKMQEKYAQ